MKRDSRKPWAIRVLRSAAAQVATTAAAALVSSGCGSSKDPSAGTVSVVVSALGASDVAGATLSVSASDLSTPISAPLAWSGGQWGTTLDGIPAGSNRTFAFSAFDAARVEQFRGETGGVTILPAQIQSVVIQAQPTTASAPWRDSVPVIDRVQASAGAVEPGGMLTLNMVAHDPDPGDSLAFSWTASHGTLGAPSSQSTTWRAPEAEGTYVILASVRDSKQEATSASLQVVVSNQSTPDAGSGDGGTVPVHAPIPPSLKWLLAAILLAVGSVAGGRQRLASCRNIVTKM